MFKKLTAWEQSRAHQRTIVSLYVEVFGRGRKGRHENTEEGHLTQTGGSGEV